MAVAQLRIQIDDFRAIGRADIVMNGITVIAGENGCGKSTISKLLYHTFDVSRDYEVIVKRRLKWNVDRMIAGLKGIIEDYSFYMGAQRMGDLSRDFVVVPVDDLKDSHERLKSNIAIVERVINNSAAENSDRPFQEDRIKRILMDLLFIDSKRGDDYSVYALFELLGEEVDNLFRRAQQNITDRRISELDNQLRRVFKEVEVFDCLNLFEYDVAITDRRLNRLMPLRTVDEVIYIDTPMALGSLSRIIGESTSYWRELNRLLEREPEFNIPVEEESVERLITNEILSGDVFFRAGGVSNDRLRYLRNDGKEFNMFDCATGMKSFAIIRMLLKNGFLTEKTVLLIDEPEVHLHPQWIVEYARLIVLLNKSLGVKFLISSHSPDMVSALKYISEKEGTSDFVNFYIANKRDGGYLYDYKYLGNEITEIFESYNMSYEKLDRYGDTGTFKE